MRKRSLSSLSENLAVSLLVILGLTPAIRAQEDDVEAPVAGAVAAFEIPENQFDHWIFQNLPSADAARNHLDKMLVLHADDVGRVCQLEDAQRRKLQLAGRGDLKRFFDRVETLRAKFQLVRKDQQKFNNLWQEISPLQAMFLAGLHGDNSLFRKSLRTILSESQRVEFEQQDAERRLFHYRARIELALAMLDLALPLRDEQRQKLIALLVQQSKPPRQTGSGQQEYYYVMWSLSQLPEASLRPLFDEAEWVVLSRQLAQGRGMQQWLVQNGLVPHDNKAK